MSSVHTINDKIPSALCGVKCPPVACTTVCRVYSGLVPRSPNTTPSAAKLVHPAAVSSVRGLGEPPLVVDLPCMIVNSLGTKPLPYWFQCGAGEEMSRVDSAAARRHAIARTSYSLRPDCQHTLIPWFFARIGEH